jgi:UDP-N-acetylglucosamine:LPS N-acetylglucosamine transferase
VVSASMGAGHDGAARELVRRLKAEGHEAEMRDFLASAPLRIGALLKSSYEFQMRHVAWSYDLTYRMWYRLPALCPPLGRFMARLTGPHLLVWATEYQADVIVSTYPLTSVVLGQLRQGGRLDVPTINFITDFGVHPLWTHPGIDLNLSVHPRPAAVAEAKSGRPTIATGPMVSPRFAEPQHRAGTRQALGLADTDRAVLIVSGSWGVGHVASTFRSIAASGRFVPIVVCGTDEHLRERLSHVPGGRVLGWADNMPALMAAADALVENAGGLTAMEALSVGLPIISYRPIAGHGKENTAEMQKAGVSRVARTPGQLLQFLDQVTAEGPARQAMIDAGRAMFVADPTRYVEHAAAVGAVRLGDRDLLAAVGAGFANVNPDELAAAADRVAFDPAEELRALLAGAASAAGGPDLAPVVPIGLARSGDSATSDGVEALPATGTESAEIVALKPRPSVAPPPGPAGDDGAEWEQLAATGTDGRDNRPSDDRPSDDGPGGGPTEDVGPRRPRRPSVRVARLAALVAAVPLLWAALTSGVNVATAYGAGVAHPASHPGNVAYIGVRLDDTQISDPVIAQQLADLHATAVVDEQTALSNPGEVQHLVTLGIDVENGGAGPRVNSEGHRVVQSPWTRANGDVAASHLLARIAGQPVNVFVPGRRLNAFDLMACYGAHNKTVVPDRVLQPADDDPLVHVTARHTYLVTGAKATTQQMESTLSQLGARLAAAGLSGAPLSDLV